MIESPASASTRPSSLLQLLLRLALWAALAGLAAILVLQLFFFAVHAAHLLRYPYPLDYGEGPLLAQVDLLRGGTPIWRLYGDPDLPPYAVVNYPPIYHLAAAALSLLTRNTLLAGRLVALAAALASVAALWRLSNVQTFQRPNVRTLIVLAFLALPIVREWAVLLRVDLLGVCLGLWALVIVQRNAGRLTVLWAALPLTLSLLVKPSLIAAPAAALIWLFFRDWRRAALLGGLTAVVGGLLVGLMQVGSGGWFLLHVLSANANAWDRHLAYGFWHDQMVILWPLVAAAALSTLFPFLRREPRIPSTGRFPSWSRGRAGENQEPRTKNRHPHGQLPAKNQEPRTGARTVNQEPEASDAQSPEMVLSSRFSVLLALYYTLFGAIVAYGVGKVGAYANYFLEFYAGLIWLAAVGSQRSLVGSRQRSTVDPRHVETVEETRPFSILNSAFSILIILLVIAAQLRYYPTWSATYLKLAGIIEGKNPPRLLVGGYGLWQDLQRERDILATLSGVNAALDDEVRATNGPIFTDVPGVAAQSGQLARLQAFEYRQLLEAGLADQSGLLRDLASGRVPLVVLDYLGNWLTPEMIALITHRYAQDGSRGTYDLYRPVDPGPAVAVDRAFPGGLQLAAYHLAASAGRPAYHGGETVLLTLDWQQQRTENPFDRTVPEPVEGQGRQEPRTMCNASQIRSAFPRFSQFLQFLREGPQGTERTQGTGHEPEDRCTTRDLEVVVQVMDRQRNIILETARPLLYGALPPSAWGPDTVEHLQPLDLPLDIPPATYQIAITLRAAGQDLAPQQSLAPLVIEAPAGRQIGENGYYVPAQMLDAWRELGGDDATGLGDPLMPATPFQGFTLQCFARACLKMTNGVVQREPLGELVHLADAGLRPAGAATDGEIGDDFRAFWEANGGVEAFGPPITPELIRGDRIVQYTRYARLERPIGGGAVRLGRLGEEFLRLPGGVPYRWP
jgi:hypothetical protein